jgi:cytochrome P450
MQFGVPDAVQSTVDANLHRMPRSAMAPFFTTRRICLYEPIIKPKLENISTRLERLKCSGQVAEMRLLLWYMATDIITEIAFPEGLGLLAAPELNPSHRAFQSSGQRKLQYFKHFPFLWTILHKMPPKWLIKLVPEAQPTIEWERRNKAHLTQLISQHIQVKPPQGTTILHQLLKSDLPAPEKSHSRIWQESASLVGAGVETVSNAICVTLVYLHLNPSCLSSLKNELQAAIPNPAQIPSYTELARLPYLSAVVNEGLRKAVGISHRFIRVVPDGAIAYGTYILPPGTAVSMSTIVMHSRSDVFPNPDAFIPERWLEAENRDGEKADRRLLMTFGKGPRMCLGQNLALAEITTVLATLVVRFELELFETGLRDVDVMHDSLLPMPWAGSKGVRFKVN